MSDKSISWWRTNFTSEDIEKVKGTEIDYIVTEVGEGFRINNPNPAPEGKKGECGCGSESSCC